jgi:hypothetical protein
VNGLDAGDLQRWFRQPSVLRPSDDGEGVYIAQCYHLLSSHANSFDRKLSTTHVKQIFQIGSQQINNKNIMEPLLSEIVDLRYAS